MLSLSTKQVSPKNSASESFFFFFRGGEYKLIVAEDEKDFHACCIPIKKRLLDFINADYLKGDHYTNK